MSPSIPRSRLPSRGLFVLVLVGSAATGRGQLLHRSTSGFESVTQTASFLDTWEQGGSALAGRPRDLLTRIERSSSTERSTEVDLLLFGPWGSHLYRFDELTTSSARPLQSFRRTTWRAVDIDDDGRKELVLVERLATARIALVESGAPAEEPGPFFDDLAITVRRLERSGDTLLEHSMDANPDDPAFAALLAHELGGPTNMALQLLAADWLFKQQQFEKARYRYRIAREWAEAQLTGRDIADLAPDMPLVSVDPDEAAITWIQAVRRIGSLPPWFQKH